MQRRISLSRRHACNACAKASNGSRGVLRQEDARLFHPWHLRVSTCSEKDTIPAHSPWLQASARTALSQSRQLVSALRKNKSQHQRFATMPTVTACSITTTEPIQRQNTAPHVENDDSLTIQLPVPMFGVCFNFKRVLPPTKHSGRKCVLNHNYLPRRQIRFWHRHQICRHNVERVLVSNETFLHTVLNKSILPLDPVNQKLPNTSLADWNLEASGTTKRAHRGNHVWAVGRFCGAFAQEKLASSLTQFCSQKSQTCQHKKVFVCIHSRPKRVKLRQLPHQRCPNFLKLYT